MSNADHQRLVTALEALLYRLDPIGIAFGDNPDEYSPEAGTIAPRLQDARSVDDIERVVHEEFVRWFDADTAGPSSAYREIAEEIGTLLGRRPPHRAS
jgi:hypothetical protein